MGLLVQSCINSFIDYFMTWLTDFPGCPSLADTLKAEPDSVCLPNPDCLGIDCSVSLRREFLRDHALVTVRAVPGNKTLKIAVNGSEHSVSQSGESVFSLLLKQQLKKGIIFTSFMIVEIASVLQQDPKTRARLKKHNKTKTDNFI